MFLAAAAAPEQAAGGGAVGSASPGPNRGRGQRLYLQMASTAWSAALSHRPHPQSGCRPCLEGSR